MHHDHRPEDGQVHARCRKPVTSQLQEGIQKRDHQGNPSYDPKAPNRMVAHTTDQLEDTPKKLTANERTTRFTNTARTIVSGPTHTSLRVAILSWDVERVEVDIMFFFPPFNVLLPTN